MRIFEIPSPTPPFYTARLSMDGTEYYVRLEWNQRAGWLIGLSDSQEQVIFSPRALVVGQDLLMHTVDSRKPSGALVCYDTAGVKKEPAYADLGSRHLLVYLTEDELT